MSEINSDLGLDEDKVKETFNRLAEERGRRGRMKEATQPPLIHIHRWVTYQTQYPHDWRLCLDCQRTEQVQWEAADRLQELMELVHARPGQHRIRGRMGHARLNAGPAIHLLAAIDTTGDCFRITAQPPTPRETRELATAAEAAGYLEELLEQFAVDSDGWKRQALEGM